MSTNSSTSTNASTEKDGAKRLTSDNNVLESSRDGARINDEDSNEASQKSDRNAEANSKQQRLLHFHRLNQEFLTKQQQSFQHKQSQGNPYTRDEETRLLHKKIDALEEQVQHLSHELRVTQDAHQVQRDQSLSEMELLCSELDRQKSRHDQIVESFRKRLIESETARIKMQDQLSAYMEKDIQREKDFKDTWKQATTRVKDDTKWVDEQMDIWKDSMEEHQKRLAEAKLRGRIDAELGGKEKLALSNTQGGGQTAVAGQGRRLLWSGSGDDACDNDSEDTDEEEMRMYGMILH